MDPPPIVSDGICIRAKSKRRRIRECYTSHVMFNFLKKRAPVVLATPQVKRSKLEVLFATSEESREREIDKILRNPKCPSLASVIISATILTYAGQRAARLQDAINITKQEFDTIATKEERLDISCEFDQIFTEVAALCFWSVMNRYWNDDEGDFWVNEESADLDYLEDLRDALDFADSLIGDATKAVPEHYLYSDVKSYQREGPGNSSQAMERFTRSIGTWTFWGMTPTMSADFATRVVAAFSLNTIGEVNRNELDALCRLSYARTA